MEYTFTKEENKYELLPTGDYEVTIEEIAKRVLPSGKEKLAIKFRVRSDVEQTGKNRVLFEDIWTERENPQYFNRKRLNQLLGTQEIEDGRVFNDINEIISFLNGGNLIAHVTIEFNDYRGEDQNTVQYYKSSQHKAQNLTLGSVEEKEEEIEISRDELPF